MKKTISLIIFLSCSTVVWGKENNDTLAVYKTIIEKLKTSPYYRPFNVNIATKKARTFDFVGISGYPDERGAKIRAKENWQKFISQIDTATIKEFKLETRV